MKPWDFLKQFCSQTWPGQENTSNIETSLRGRRSKGKGKGIRAWDHARVLSRLKLPFTKLPFPSLSNACHAGYIETKSNDNRKATKQELDRYEVTKENIADRIFVLGKVTNGTGNGEWGFRREGRGESNLICLSPGESQPFKLTTSHPFSPNLYHHLVTHPVRLRFLLSF